MVTASVRRRGVHGQPGGLGVVCVDGGGEVMKSSREQFEEWFNEIMKPEMEKFDIDWPERRMVNVVSWSAWQASRSSLVIKQGISVDVVKTDSMGNEISRYGMKLGGEA